MSYTVLAFPDLRDFLKHLKGRGINQFGKVMRQENTTGKNGTPLVTLTIRLSARDETRQEIIRCDLTFYRALYFTKNILKEESKEARTKIEEYITKIIKEEAGDIPFDQLAAEFQPVKETTER